jgi:aminoglycoside phosphotransferase (APT) family kinase protein
VSAHIDADLQHLPGDELIDLVRTRLDTAHIVAIESRSNDFSTKASSSFVTVHPEHGEEVQLFVKKILVEPASRLPDPIDREARVYEAFSSDPEFAAPTLVGIIGDDDPHLVLIASTGWDLRYQDLDSWAMAAVDLGRMHAAFASRVSELEAHDFLDRHDTGQNLAVAKLASTVVSEKHAGAAQMIQEVIDGYERIAEELAHEPRTLIHGDLAPKNVVIDNHGGTERALFVDWEWAGIGPGLGDLADFVNGLDETAIERMLAAYCDGAGLSNEDAVLRSFTLALLHKTMFRLGRSSDWQVTDGEVTAWAQEAVALYSELGA